MSQTVDNRGNTQGIVYLQDEVFVAGQITSADVSSSTNSGQNGCSIISGTPTPNSCVQRAITNMCTTRIQVSGTWVGTLIFEFSADNGVTWILAAFQINGTIFTASGCTANGVFMGDSSGCTNFRVRATAWTSGTAIVSGVSSTTSGVVKINNAIRLVDNTTGSQLSIIGGKAQVDATVSIDTTGLATDANQTNGNQKTQIVDAGGDAVTVTGGKLDVNAAIDTTGLATSAKQDTGNTSLSSIDGKITAVNTGAVVVSSSALPSGAATSGKQDTGNTSLSSIDTKLTDKSQFTKITDGVDTALVTAAGEVNVLATAQPGVDIGDITINNAAGASAVNIQDGGNSITIDAASLPLPTGAATSAAQTDKSQFTKITDGTDTALVTAAGEQNVLESNSAAIKTAVELLDNAVSGAGFNITQVGGTNIDTNSGNKSAGTQRVVLATDQPNLTTPLNTSVSSITPPALTKGTQGATGFSVQSLKDAGRTAVMYYAVAAAAGATNTETAITLTKASGTAATSTGTSFVITSGKIFRIIAITFATRGHNTATAQTTAFKFRINTGGAVITSTTPIILSMRSATPATANAWDRVIVPLPDGIEIAGDRTLQFGITAAATYTTNAPTWDVTIIGFEY